MLKSRDIGGCRNATHNFDITLGFTTVALDNDRC